MNEDVDVQNREVNVNWLRINVPSVAAIVFTGVIVSMYVQNLANKVTAIESNSKDRSVVVDKSFDQIKDQLSPLVNVPYRMTSVENSLLATNQRMDTYLQTIGAKIDGVIGQVNAMSTKVEVLGQKIDTITPEKKASSNMSTVYR